MNAPHFLVHNQKDTVGVIVVEGVQAGMPLTGWVMDADETIAVTARDPIPLGHKIGLRDIRKGEAIIKYGHDAGEATAEIGEGRHVHVHNVKTRRW